MKIRPFFISAFILTIPMMLYADYNKALKLFEQGKYDDALTEIASVLDVSRDFETNTPNYNLRYLAGHIHAKKGNYESALTHLKRCAEIQKDTINPLIDIAFIYIDSKRYTDAMTWARKALQIKQEPVAYYILGLAYSGIGSYWQAKEYLEKAISLDPEMYYAYNELGNVLMALGRITQAQTAYSAAYALAPSSAYICNNLAMSYVQGGDVKKAIEIIEKARKLAPDNPIIVENYNRIVSLRK
ncbi:MAG: tetratricopeptide repeat protein [Spirochaetota bacterium]|nr:tetratricopeptide repeat protein [Spirochaetota bacterium]